MRGWMAAGAAAIVLVHFAVTGWAADCPATKPDQLGPFYVPGAPERSRVGTGYVLEGTVRSAKECAPVPGARIELWLAGPDGGYGDAWRATVIADGKGGYRFESHVPPEYYSRPPHIHLRISAEGYRMLVTQHYPAAGASQTRFDIVLSPVP